MADEAGHDVGDAPLTHESVLMATVRATLVRHGYRYLLVDANTLWLYIRSEAGLYSLDFNTNDESDLVRLAGCYGSYVPDDRRVAVAELLTRINTRLGFGNFELDFDDGEVRFRIGADVEGGWLAESVVDRMMSYALGTLDRYHQAVMAVAFGGTEPVVALSAAT